MTYQASNRIATAPGQLIEIVEAAKALCINAVAERWYGLGSDATNEEVQAVVNEITKGLYSITVSSNTVKIYRGRKTKTGQPFLNLSDLWLPPPELCIDFGRCNYPGKPVFYGCLRHDTPIIELNATKGEYVHIIECIVKPNTKLNMFSIGIVDDGVYQGKDQMIEVIKRGLDSMANELHLSSEAVSRRHEISTFLATEFTKNVDGDNLKYRLTAAIAAVYLSYDRADGILYPSVARQKHQLNAAIKPDAANKKLVPLVYLIGRVVEHRDEERVVRIQNKWAIRDWKIQFANSAKD